MNSGERLGKEFKVSAVLPAYNEARNLEPVVEDLTRVLKKITDSFELIIVDDGSKDGTHELADELSKRDFRVRAVHHPVNMGYGAALRSGFGAASHDWIFFTDADGQFDPENLTMLIPLAGQHQFVTGYRENRMDPWHRRAYGAIFSALIRALFGVKVKDVNCAFKLFKKSLVEHTELSVSGAPNNAELLIAAKKKGVDPAEVPVTHRARQKGEATGGSLKVIMRAAREIIELWIRTR